MDLTFISQSVEQSKLHRVWIDHHVSHIGWQASRKSSIKLGLSSPVSPHCGAAAGRMAPAPGTHLLLHLLLLLLARARGASWGEVVGRQASQGGDPVGTVPSCNLLMCPITELAKNLFKENTPLA